LAQAAWLSKRSNVDYVELLTNGSLLRTRLDQLDRDGDLRKISLWVTHHHTEISVSRFIENARIAQERYGCFVVVNGLLFPDNEAALLELKQAATRAGLRFNLDLGYDPWTPQTTRTSIGDMVPALKNDDEGVERAVRLGANEELLQLNLSAMRDLNGKMCGAGYDYFYIDIRGNVYRCSRYQAQGRERMGNVTEDGFQLHLNRTPWVPCRAGSGCCNKEDFLNLMPQRYRDGATAPSLGWIEPSSRTRAAPLTGDGDRCG
jgi:MoaA/NifB/PqqE/SkfB family radical SAM enzyme